MWNANPQFNEPIGEWHSGIKSVSQRSAIDINDMHRAVHARASESVSKAFADIQRALTDLQIDIQTKLRDLFNHQQELISTTRASDDAIVTFEENVKKITRSLDRMADHADNLSHIKLTIARISAIVSPGSDLAQLVTVGGSECKNVYTDRRLSPGPHQYENSTRAILANSRDMLERPARTICTTDSPIANPISARQNVVSLPEGARAVDTNGKTCFVFYLPTDVDRHELKSLFLPCGNVMNAHVTTDKLTGMSKGFGFVDFASAAEAQLAVKMMDKFPIKGKVLSVSIKT